MAVVLVNSTLIAKNIGTPQVLAPTTEDGGRVRSKVATNAIANGDSVASIYRYFRVHSSARIECLMMDSDDIGTTGAGDVGLYQTAENGGAVVDADFFASALVLNGGALANQNITRESAVVDHINKGKRLWEQLGLTVDPNRFYDVALTLTGAADGAGDVTLSLSYVQD